VAGNICYSMSMIILHQICRSGLSLCSLCCCLALLSAGCAKIEEEGGGPPGVAAGVARAVFAVTCDASLEAYPVHGPHNGGYDSNWDNFTCPPHPDTSPDNSDFIAGSHYGNDIFAERGTDVVAAKSGSVVSSGEDSVGGWSITIVDSCGWWYYYCHFDAASSIPEGATVSAGDVIGAVGNSGSAYTTAPHLHFSIFPDGNYTDGIDPFPLLETVDGTACGGSCVCSAGDTITQDCLDCGTHTRSCGADDCTWSDWSNCEGPDPDGGTRVCDTGEPGRCGEGRVRCVGGTETCVGLYEPSTEVCDLIDNDCDGQVDETCADGAEEGPGEVAASWGDAAAAPSADGCGSEPGGKMRPA
jgi:hypothetical protein